MRRLTVMKNKIIRVVAILACLTLVVGAFAACGGKEKPDENAFDKALIERFGGDWNGCVEFVDGTGKYETLTGTVAAIARLNIDSEGNITPFIGLDVEDTPIENLTAKFDGDKILLGGKWISADFADTEMTEKNGTLSTRIDVSKEAGSIGLVFNFRRLDDTGWTDEKPGFSESQINECMGKSFDELAEIIGYSSSDYPAALSTEQPENTKEDTKDSGKKAEKGSIVGTWEYTGGGYSYTFNADGTGSYNYGTTVMEFTYTDDGSTVSIKYTTNTVASDYAYTIEGNTLKIEDSFGDTVEYIKK